MEVIEMSVSELQEVQTSGFSLKTNKAKDLASGIYSVIELKDVEKRTKEQVIESLTKYYGEQPKWADNLPATNMSGFCRLKLGNKNISVYLNNALFNLMIEGKALKQKQDGDKVTVSLTGKSFKI